MHRSLFLILIKGSNKYDSKDPPYGFHHRLYIHVHVSFINLLRVTSFFHINIFRNDGLLTPQKLNNIVHL